MFLNLHSESLKSEWLDAYGHMNEAYYLVAFSNATWALQDYLSVGPEYTRSRNRALYTVESHLRYLREVRAPAELVVASALLGFDAKRIHIAHVLTVEGQEHATFECVILHVDLETGRSCSFSEEQLDSLQSILSETKPSWSGSRVSLSRS